MEENLVIIDADSLIYLIGSQLENMQLEPLGIIKLDEFIQDILITTSSKSFIGFIGGGDGRNFRKDIAVTKPYKGNRPEKPEWFVFWQPILSERMITHWGFQPCHNIEADDACGIARTAFKDKYTKIIIASPDKDLFQIGGTWFYDYTKRTTVFCDEVVALNKLCHQIITGDSTDNIPGCIGAGKAAADTAMEGIAKEGLSTIEALQKVKEFYIDWFTVQAVDKQRKKQEKEYLDAYREANSIKVLRADKKSEALKDFVLDTSMIMTIPEVEALFHEQYQLVKLLETEAEGLTHGFVLAEPTIDSSVDWDNILTFHEEIDQVAEEEHFFFEDDL